MASFTNIRSLFWQATSPTAAGGRSRKNLIALEFLEGRALTSTGVTSHLSGPCIAAARARVMAEGTPSHPPEPFIAVGGAQVLARATRSFPPGPQSSIPLARS
jgi:hypothetical protein